MTIDVRELALQALREAHGCGHTEPERSWLPPPHHWNAIERALRSVAADAVAQRDVEWCTAFVFAFGSDSGLTAPLIPDAVARALERYRERVVAEARKDASAELERLSAALDAPDSCFEHVGNSCSDWCPSCKEGKRGAMLRELTSKP